MVSVPSAVTDDWVVSYAPSHDNGDGTYDFDITNLNVANTGGSPITQWQLTWSTTSNFSSNNHTTAADVVDGDVLKLYALSLNTTYYVKILAVNVAGAGPYSVVRTYKTPLFTQVNIGGIWKFAEVYVKVAGVWKSATRYVRVGGVWKQ